MAYERSLVIPKVEYKSPNDFTAVYSSTTSIQLSGLPITIQNSAQISYVKVINETTGGATGRTYINGSYGVAFAYDSATDIVTVYPGSSLFDADDVYVVGLDGATKGFDLGLDLFKFQEQSPANTWATDGEQLVTSAQDITASWVDMGSEIDMRDFTDLNVFLTVDINDGQNVRIKALGKHEFDGTDEFDFIQGTDNGTITTITPTYTELESDTDQLIMLKFKTYGIPYIQLQVMAVIAGDEVTGETAAAISDCYINKIWK